MPHFVSEIVHGTPLLHWSNTTVFRTLRRKIDVSPPRDFEHHGGAPKLGCHIGTAIVPYSFKVGQHDCRVSPQKSNIGPAFSAVKYGLFGVFWLTPVLALFCLGVQNPAFSAISLWFGFAITQAMA